jgi:hypothetical protein
MQTLKTYFEQIPVDIVKKIAGGKDRCPLAQNHEPTEEEWRELARQAVKEQDPDKMIALAEQILEKYDEEKRRRNHRQAVGIRIVRAR